jgi:hypothetical protein
LTREDGFSSSSSNDAIEMANMAETTRKMQKALFSIVFSLQLQLCVDSCRLGAVPGAAFIDKELF